MKNGPVIDKNGTKRWLVNGKLHRTDGPAVEWAGGNKEWCVDGELHRTDGPAIECADGGKQWCVDGELHRTDGPAIERADGGKQWWINNKYLGDNDQGFWALWDKLTDEQRNNLDLLMWLPSSV